MKKLLSLLLTMVIMVMPVQLFANDNNSDGIDEGLVESWSVGFKYGTSPYTHDTLVTFAKDAIKEGLVTIDEIKDPDVDLYELEDDPSVPKDTVQWWVDAQIDAFKNKSPSSKNYATLVAFFKRVISEETLFVEELYDAPKVNAEYARLEILTKQTKSLRGQVRGEPYPVDTIFVNGSYYTTVVKEHKAEETLYSQLIKDGKTEYTFKDGYIPRQITHIGSRIYIAFSVGLYEYTDGKLVEVAPFGDSKGYIFGITNNNTDLYVFCSDSEVADMNARVFSASIYKVSPEGDVEAIKGKYPEFTYASMGITINKDGDRMVYVSSGNGIPVRKLTTGESYVQLGNDNTDYKYGYCVDNVLYYNNCLLANVNGSLVYYDYDKAKDEQVRKLLVGDMKGDRDQRSMKVAARGELPIQTGIGNEVCLGTVLFWDIGTDGNIYGTLLSGSERDNNAYQFFKLTIPESVKLVNTYKKLEK